MIVKIHVYNLQKPTLSANFCIILANVNTISEEPPVVSVQQFEAEWNCIPIATSSKSSSMSAITSNFSSTLTRNVSSSAGAGVVWSPSARTRLVGGAAGAGVSVWTGSGVVRSPGYPRGVKPALKRSFELVPAASSLTERVQLEFTAVDLGQPGLSNVNDSALTPILYCISYHSPILVFGVCLVCARYYAE